MNTLVRMQILYEIAMELGVEVDLHRTAKRGLSAYLNRLGCAAGMVVRAPGSGPEGLAYIVTVPRKLMSNAAFRQELARIHSLIAADGLEAFLGSLPQTRIADGTHYHIMELKGFGFLLLLKRGEPFDHGALHGIGRLNQKLGEVCLAGLHNDSLEAAVRSRTEELQKANDELKESLANVKTLKGLLPICSNCKKIRDDRGYWNQIEAYLHAHADAEFTHGICPNCIKTLYPEFVGEEGLGIE